MRADQLLVQAGLARTRSQAQRLIAAGAQWRLAGGAWQPVRKNGDELPLAAELQLLDDAEARYVSRGGLKLEGALDACGLVVRGWRCLDVGQSTGGFTDCLLQRGAAAVVGVDVGHGQLHPRLAGDVRVTSLEKCNARELQRAQVDPAGAGFALITGDLSFISLALVLPALAACMDGDTQLLMLVKPQFELQPQQLGKGGVVRDERLYAEVEARIRAACLPLDLQVRQWLPSPITGGDGNREFFMWAVRARA
ncbi:TlyA family RNA methyltransferase [Corticibacter populi]|uniref:TlyA family RNA methyltransferase n=1 Tax=Corticibacter populi TaxID=1550736 RepID=A0A3M6QKJ0_9BURK|nr:TlyA family RNA methyltransferase [Corticibacter populi]RMX03445.1 TlyA family RNA methyltransferase [Corticibacter populi]RZS29880.1 23S rRNA (cytidine1920-2'-O)/16S rRNA (cytidine1409-2'-O)-methyltransferase [Corticibacter populi]